MGRNNARRQDPRAGRSTFLDRTPTTRVEPASADELRREREKLETTMAEIKDLIRSGHELLQALKEEHRKIRRYVPMQVTNAIKREMDKQVPPALADLGQHIDTAKAAILKKFDEIFDTLMGDDPASRKNGLRPLPDLIKTMREVHADAAEHARRLDLQNALEEEHGSDDRSGRVPGFVDTGYNTNVPTIEGFNNL